MKVFVAGATGALGRRLVPQLVARGHDVVAMTRSAEGAARAGALGAEPVVADALDGQAVARAVMHAAPEAVVHQLSALSGLRDFRRFDRSFALTNRLRTEGTDHLVAAARAAGVRRIVAQSYGNWIYEPVGSWVKSEDDPLDHSPLPAQRRTLDAIRHLERVVTGTTDLEGVALRYGAFYGPGTGLARDGDVAAMVRARKWPVVGKGSGVWSFVHVDDAAAATVAAVERGAPGIYNVCDDAPAPVAEWLPELARVLCARAPLHVPVWVGRLAAGDVAVSMMTRVRGMSNEKAKRELAWAPAHRRWRDGFRVAMAA